MLILNLALEQTKTLSRRSLLTEKRIKEQGKSLFSEKGFHNVSVRELSKSCKMALGLLYRYYRNKEDLLKVILSESFSKLLLDIEAIPNKNTVKEYFFELHLVLTKNFDTWKIYQSVRWDNSLQKILVEEFSFLNANMCESLRVVLKKSGQKSPLLTAKTVYAAIDGIFALKCLDKDFPVEKCLALLANCGEEQSNY